MSLTVPPGVPLFNRELSWLAFNARVLHEAQDERTPLLERVKFLSIFSSNLDEFYMVRVAGLRRQVLAGVRTLSPDGLSAQEQLDAIDREVRVLLHAQRRVLEELLQELASQDVRLLQVDELTPQEWSWLDGYFEREVFPVLTPLAIDPGHPFPYISNLSISLVVQLADMETGVEHLARVKVPKSLPRLVPVAGRHHHFLPLERLIAVNLGTLFPGMRIVGAHGFRITRYSDLELAQQEPAEDLLAAMEAQVFERRFGEVVRLEVSDGMPQALRALLLDELRDDELPTSPPLTDGDVQEQGELLDASDLMELAQLDLPGLRYEPFVPTVPPEVRDGEESLFSVLRHRDLLVHHPFESFSATVERFLEAAAVDEHVLAIKLSLYRTSGDTAIVHALTEAARRGKQVAVLVELKARFEETANISWARTLERFGVHVAYGTPLLKTHAKIALVVRRDPDGIRRYVHIGTGNYNSRTARAYTDLGLLSSREDLAADVGDLFNALTGVSRNRQYRRLLVAPDALRSRLLRLIEREAAHARAGRPARIVAKMNALTDAPVIQALYEASAAGVEIDLIVRGICCLRPQLPGVSESIRVISVVGRFLEHSRLWHFHHDGAEEYYLGSADWMERNLDRRVEAVTPVEGDDLRERLRTLLETLLRDDRQAWTLANDGAWTQRTPGHENRATHELLLLDPWGRSAPDVPGEASHPTAVIAAAMSPDGDDSADRGPFAEQGTATPRFGGDVIHLGEHERV